MKDNQNVVVAEPFGKMDRIETENGTVVELLDQVLVKPTYISQRLPATAVTLYYDPIGLPGGSNEVQEEPRLHKCVPTVRFRFDVPKDHEYSHMDGKEVSIEIYNLDFCVGETEEIHSDRSGCNA